MALTIFCFLLSTLYFPLSAFALHLHSRMFNPLNPRTVLYKVRQPFTRVMPYCTAKLSFERNISEFMGKTFPFLHLVKIMLFDKNPAIARCYNSGRKLASVLLVLPAVLVCPDPENPENCRPRYGVNVNRGERRS